MKEVEDLKTYVRNWKDLEGCKPCDEAAFIAPFIKVLESADEGDFEFDGDGSYFGKQVTFRYGSYYSWGYTDIELHFEIAYAKDQIRIYTAYHNGFWTQEYVNMTEHNPNFERLSQAIFTKLRGVFGL